MAAAFFLATLFAAFLIGLGLRLRGKHWFRAWFFASLVIPIAVSVVDFFQPSGGMESRYSLGLFTESRLEELAR
jgi:hypothetical protein